MVYGKIILKSTETFKLKQAFLRIMAKTRLSDKEYHTMLANARKDPQFRKDIKKFIKVTTSVYRLKDYGLENL